MKNRLSFSNECNSSYLFFVFGLFGQLKFLEYYWELSVQEILSGSSSASLLSASDGLDLLGRAMLTLFRIPRKKWLSYCS